MEASEKKLSGWVVVNDNHPRNTDSLMICVESFSRTRTKAIKEFVDGSGSDWRYWKRKYNFKVVRAEMAIKITV